MNAARDPDRELIDYVNRAINTGTREIVIPASLLRHASDEAIETVRQMCTLCGVSTTVAGHE